jgi:hypothetical protein
MAKLKPMIYNDNIFTLHKTRESRRIVSFGEKEDKLVSD